MNVLKPREAVPALEVETLDGPWSLADQNPDNFTLVVFYRGLHCPICTKYIGELDRLESDFDEIGVSVLALSTDTRERAAQARQNWELKNLNPGYGVTVEQCRDWGSASLGQPWSDIDRYRGARRVQRTGHLHCAPRQHALLGAD